MNLSLGMYSGGVGNFISSYAPITGATASVLVIDTSKDTATTINYITGTVNNDTLQGTSANDYISGGDGIDTAIWRGNKKQYQISPIAKGWSVRSLITDEGTDTLEEVERLQFNDVRLALDLNANAGITAKVLGAVFGKDSVTNKNYVGIGLSFLDSGWTYDNLAALALDVAGAKTNDQIVSLLWANVIGSKPSAADKAQFISLLQSGMTAGALAHLAADTSFNTTNINLIGLTQTGIEFTPA